MPLALDQSQSTLPWPAAAAYAQQLWAWHTGKYTYTWHAITAQHSSCPCLLHPPWLLCGAAPLLTKMPAHASTLHRLWVTCMKSAVIAWPNALMLAQQTVSLGSLDALHITPGSAPCHSARRATQSGGDCTLHGSLAHPVTRSSLRTCGPRLHWPVGNAALWSSAAAARRLPGALPSCAAAHAQTPLPAAALPAPGLHLCSLTRPLLGKTTSIPVLAHVSCAVAGCT